MANETQVIRVEHVITVEQMDAYTSPFSTERSPKGTAVVGTTSQGAEGTSTRTPKAVGKGGIVKTFAKIATPAYVISKGLSIVNNEISRIGSRTGRNDAERRISQNIQSYKRLITPLSSAIEANYAFEDYRIERAETNYVANYKSRQANALGITGKEIKL